MKSFRSLSFLLSVFFVQALFSQSATSVANGPWLSPFTWNCMCVPTPGYTVTINHQVTLNTSFQIPSGGITVNVGGSLLQDSARDMLMNGGYLINHGQVNFRYLLLQGGKVTNTDSLSLKSFANYATIENSGIFYRVDSFYNLGYIHNTGIVSTKKFQNNDSLINEGLFLVADSFYNTALMTNADSVLTPTFFNTGTLLNNGYIGGVDSFANLGVLVNNIPATIDADSMLNGGTLTNDGRLNTTAFANTGTIQNQGTLTFYDAFNLNQFINTDTLRGLHSLTNISEFQNLIGGHIYLAGSFLNADSISHRAHFTNNGIMIVDSNWSNVDTVSGNYGSITVSLLSNNSGFLLGNFDFCDLTPPPSSPFIDQNSGTISPQITWCSPAPPVAVFTTANSNVCLGQVVSFSNSSTGSINSFLWYFGDGDSSTQVNPSHLYTAAGQYQAMLLAIGSSDTDTTYTQVNVSPLPPTPSISASGDTVSCNLSGYTYHWYLNQLSNSSWTQQSFVAMQTGYYAVQVSDSNNCFSLLSDSILVDIGTGIKNIAGILKFEISPNPCNGKTTLKFILNQSGAVNLSLYTILGERIYTNTVQEKANANHEIPIDLSAQPAGIYLYHLSCNGHLLSGHLIKQ